MTNQDETEHETQTAPVVEGEEFWLNLESEGDEGDGIGFRDGFAIIVNGGEVGDYLPVQITYVADNCAFADPLEVDEIDDDEVRPW